MLIFKNNQVIIIRGYQTFLPRGDGVELSGKEIEGRESG